MSQTPITSTNDTAFAFDNTYANLPERFYASQLPTPVKHPTMIRFNAALAEQLGLDTKNLTSNAGINILAGNQIPSGAQPIATAYAGHQFGNWVPQLGDGRAVLLGEVLDRDGQRFDIQLKGAGPTPFSRNGDGRAGIGPVLREYVVSEAMAALGIPTTRALAAVGTGDYVFREEATPGAVLTRVASSHIRVGTFQFFANRQDTDALRVLSEHVLNRHYPEFNDADNPALALLNAVIDQQVELVAQWQSVGFIHGVMNTDNASVAGLTIDYGPCAFMDNFDAGKVFSSIDRAGRYAYGNQPGIAQWNMANLAQCLLNLIDDDSDKAVEKAQGAIDAFPEKFEQAYLRRFRAKLGLTGIDDKDATLISDLLAIMQSNSDDFTQTFRAMSKAGGLQSATSNADAYAIWTEQWQQRLEQQSESREQAYALMRSVNPAYIPRNHRIEQMIESASNGDLEPLDSLATVLDKPYTEQPGFEKYAHAPSSDEEVHATYCGT